LCLVHRDEHALAVGLEEERVRVLGVERNRREPRTVELDGLVLGKQVDLQPFPLTLQKAKLLSQPIVGLEVVPNACGNVDGGRLVLRRPGTKVEIARLPDTAAGGVVGCQCE